METILKIKRKGKPNIAPLQPPTLATFRSWGSSAGAGRAGLPAAKVRKLAYDTRDQAGKDAWIDAGCHETMVKSH